MRWKTRSGKATVSATLSTLRIATFFGISSPPTMCSEVMRKNAMAKETVSTALSGTPNHENTGCSKEATTGSPSQPKPKETMVMPSCVTESATSSRSASFFAYDARRLPSAMSTSSRELRILTMENSAATKNALPKTSRKTTKIFKDNKKGSSKNSPPSKCTDISYFRLFYNRFCFSCSLFAVRRGIHHLLCRRQRRILSEERRHLLLRKRRCTKTAGRAHILLT